MRERFAVLERAYRKLIREGIDDGSIRELNVGNVVAALAGSLNWVANAEQSGRAKSLDHISKELADLAISSILA